MSERDEILAKLRRQSRVSEMPEPWKSRRNYDDLTAIFGAAFKAAGGEFMAVADWAAAEVAISALLEEAQAETVLVNGDLPLTLPERWPQIGWHLAGQSDEDLYAFAKRADVGISGVRAVLAETGSVIIESGPQKSRMTSLLPPLHIALIPRETLTADIFTWTASRGGQLPTNLVLVSGPSKSADIGMTLTTGVHGPGRIVAIVYDA